MNTVTPDFRRGVDEARRAVGRPPKPPTPVLNDRVRRALNTYYESPHEYRGQKDIAYAFRVGKNQGLKLAMILGHAGVVRFTPGVKSADPEHRVESVLAPTGLDFYEAYRKLNEYLEGVTSQRKVLPKVSSHNGQDAGQYIPIDPLVPKKYGSYGIGKEPRDVLPPILPIKSNIETIEDLVREAGSITTAELIIRSELPRRTVSWALARLVSERLHIGVVRKGRGWYQWG